jgi:heat shock protein HslJ
MRKASAVFQNLGGEWSVVELNGDKLNPEETKQQLIFDMVARRISGNGGCNLVSGDISFAGAEKKDIRFHNLISTRKACIDMSREDELFKAIDEAVRFDSAGNTTDIAFYGKDGDRLFVISRSHTPARF